VEYIIFSHIENKIYIIKTNKLYDQIWIKRDNMKDRYKKNTNLHILVYPQQTSQQTFLMKN
jgi:hypothetical protein